MRAGKIKGIKIKCYIDSGVKHYEAIISTDDIKNQILPIANADSFVQNLDKAIGEFIAQGAAISEMDKFDIK